MGSFGNLTAATRACGRRFIAVKSHHVFLGYPQVHSGPGDVINDEYPDQLTGIEKKLVALNAPILFMPFQVSPPRASALSFPALSSSVPLGALVGWMLVLTVKHIIADFVLQSSWMAIGKDQKTGWAMPLLAHCLVHLVVAMTLILIIAPRFWFVAVIDFVIHIMVDRAKGFCAARFGVTQENKHPWFWTLIGVDQALHHLTGFGLAIFMAAN